VDMVNASKEDCSSYALKLPLFDKYKHSSVLTTCCSFSTPSALNVLRASLSACSQWPTRPGTFFGLTAASPSSSARPAERASSSASSSASPSISTWPVPSFCLRFRLPLHCSRCRLCPTSILYSRQYCQNSRHICSNVLNHAASKKSMA